jgi:hypothetical protein
MLAARSWFLLLLSACLAASAQAAGSALTCDQTSKCPAGLVSEIRVAADAACPCDAAASAKGYAKCWKPVVRGFATTLGKTGFPKSCRKEVTGVLGSTSCGRAGYVLCRKPRRSGGQVCAVAKAKKCKDVFPTGPGFRSCADACAGLAAIPFPSTTELGHADLASLAPDPGDGTLRFDPAPASLDGVAIGSILVAGVSPSTPAGFLRAVLGVERNGQQLTLRTGLAPIQLAYAKLHVRTAHSTALTAPTATTQTFLPLVDFGTKKDFNYVLFDGDGDAETTNDQVAIDGEVGGGFDYDFQLDVDWGGVTALPDVVSDCLASLDNLLEGELPSCSIDDLLPEARVTFVVRPQVEANGNVHGAALLSYEKEVQLASETLPPIVVGPLVFVPKADIKAQLSGGASGAFNTGVHGSATFQTSVTVSSKQTQTPQFQEPVLVSQDFGPNETKVTLQAFAKVGVEAGLNLLAFDVTGPYATAAPYAKIDANILDAPCWDLHAGIDATLGIKVQSPDLPVVGAITLVDWQAPTVNTLDLPLAGGACDVPPDAHGDPRPPGSGPDGIHLATPTYTPWSRTYDSPVDGSHAHTPGNGVLFSSLERTIDDRFVRSGFGVAALIKFDQLGNLTWARALALNDGTPLAPLRVRSGSDATLWVASSAPGIAPIVLVKATQDGGVEEARAYDVPLDVCSVDVTALASDGAGGAWVVGQCFGDPRSFVLHATGSTATFRLLGDIEALRLNVVEPIGSDLFVAGSASEGTDALFAFRLGPDGTPAYAKRYDGCLDAPDAIPSTAIVGPQGEVTIAGSGGAQHNGLLLRIKPDGDVGFAAFPGFGFGAASVVVLDSLVELPTTGYVAGGSSVRVTGSDPDDVPSAVLVGFDAVGGILWANRYTFGDIGAFSASGQVALRLADDGGMVATTLLADALDPFAGGRLWAFKPFAKDGFADFLPGSVTVTPLGISNLTCSMTASDRPVTVDTRAIPTRVVTVTSTAVGLTVEQQTAN